MKEIRPQLLSDGHFDRVAPVYDLLVALVFGKRLLAAEISLHPEITAHSRVLVIGGGTGKALPGILSRCPGSVVFVEASGLMLKRAQKRTGSDNTLFWIKGTEWDTEAHGPYDYLVTSFFLDVFPPGRLKAVMATLGKNLKPGGKWLFTDFSLQHTRGHWWKRPLVGAMFLFFRLTVGLQSRQLPDWRLEFERAGFQEERAQAYMSGLVQALVWVRKQPGGEADAG